jgi:hypothetical protein
MASFPAEHGLDLVPRLKGLGDPAKKLFEGGEEFQIGGVRESGTLELVRPSSDPPRGGIDSCVPGDAGAPLSDSEPDLPLA